jgi:hypothetical protein
MYLEMYDQAMDGMEAKLFHRVSGSNMLLLSDLAGYRKKMKMDHLACFAPAMLALGALHAYVVLHLTCLSTCQRVGLSTRASVRMLTARLPACPCVSSEGTVLEAKRWQHLRSAKAMAYSCWQFYERQPTGLSPEYVEFSDHADPAAAKTTKRVCTFDAPLMTVHVCIGLKLPTGFRFPRSGTTRYDPRSPSRCFTCTK